MIFPLVLGAIAFLLLGLGGGLERMGWAFIPPSASLIELHGALMVGGFLGTLISLERAVSIKGKWPLLAPLFSLLGGILLFFHREAGASGLILGSFFLLLILVKLWKIQPSFHMAVMALGPASWLVGNVLFLCGEPIVNILFWWMGFLFFTIGGERLELGRLRRISRRAKGVFLVLLLLFVGALIGFSFHLSYLFFAGTFLCLSLWLLYHDIAWKTFGRGGLPRYIALSVFLGYFWVIVLNVFLLGWGNARGSFHYDLLVHAFFLGYVFSMILGHGPLIFPALLRVNLPFGPQFYFPLILFHLALVLRVVGDFRFSHALRQWGGLVGAISILLFFATVGLTVVVNLKKSTSAQ